MLAEQRFIPEEELNFPPGSITLVSGIVLDTATSTDDMWENVKKNAEHRFPILENMPEYGKLKGDKPIAIVGGGPSLDDFTILDELCLYRTIIACGSVHDFLIGQNIIPTYATNCDPDPITAGYYTKPDPEVKYLMSSTTDQKLIEALKGHQIIQWHCHSQALQERIAILEQEKNNRLYMAVCGGCTVGLRSIAMAMCMGYSNIHLFGFDSCMSDDGVHHHAYDWANPEEAKLIPKVHKIQLGPKEGPGNSKQYYVAGYQLAQLDNFKEFYLAFRDIFTPTFHGGGALSDYYDLIKPKEQANELRQ